MDRNVAIGISVSCVMASPMDNDTKKEVIQHLRSIDAKPEVTDEAVQEAIEYFEYTMQFISGSVSEFDHRLAIEALRQMRFPSAIKWTGDNLREVIDLIALHESAKKWTWEEYEQVVKNHGLKIFTPDGSVMAEIGDWIINDGRHCYVAQMRTEPPKEAGV